jgi:hypothetical protein
MSGVLILHEILHETNRRKEVGVVLKLDFEKVYDKVNWDFMYYYLQKIGFCQKWLSWMHAIVEGGTIRVKVNNQIGKYVKSFKVVR